MCALISDRNTESNLKFCGNATIGELNWAKWLSFPSFKFACIEVETRDNRFLSWNSLNHTAIFMLANHWNLNRYCNTANDTSNGCRTIQALQDVYSLQVPACTMNDKSTMRLSSKINFHDNSYLSKQKCAAMRKAGVTVFLTDDSLDSNLSHSHRSLTYCVPSIFQYGPDRSLRSGSGNQRVTKVIIPSRVPRPQSSRPTKSKLYHNCNGQGATPGTFLLGAAHHGVLWRSHWSCTLITVHLDPFMWRSYLSNKVYATFFTPPSRSLLRIDYNKSYCIAYDAKIHRIKYTVGNHCQNTSSWPGKRSVSRSRREEWCRWRKLL